MGRKIAWRKTIKVGLKCNRRLNAAEQYFPKWPKWWYFRPAAEPAE